MMSSNPPIGAIAYGRSGNACTVTQVEGDRVLLSCPAGFVRVPRSAIVRWETPGSGQPSTPPAPQFKPGDLVEVWFEDYQRWVGGYRFVEMSSWVNKAWLVDPKGVEGLSRVEWVRRAQT